MLTLDDFFLLYKPFGVAIDAQLPLPSTVDFYALSVDGAMQPLDEYLSGTPSPVTDEMQALVDPWVDAGQLVFPFPLNSGEMAVAVVSDIDLAFLRKMSPGWLKQIREVVLAEFAMIRLAAVDPETDLYNRRALNWFLESMHEEQTGIFFLLHTIFSRKTATENLQQLKETADLLTTVGEGQYFSFGYGVFGLFLPLAQRQRALKTARHLQRQLRREGMSKVQIGFAGLKGAAEGEDAQDLQRLWRALELAEKRGPFGLCDIDTLESRRSHPFVLSEPGLMSQGKDFWKRQRQFTLCLLSFSQAQPEAISFWSQNIQEKTPHLMGEMLTRGQHVLLLIQSQFSAEVQSCIDGVVEDARRHFGDDPFYAGVACYPCLDFSKNDVLANCLKAQRHASFFGPGSLVYFDHLSLNISGDYFFDEGDYKSALREYRRGLRLMPEDVNLINSLGVTLIECNQLSAAAKCFEEALQQESDNYMALVNLGRVRQTLSQPQKALSCFEEAFAAHGKKEAAGQELFLPLARLYAEAGRFENALQVLDQWSLRPGSEQEFLLYRLLGLCAMENGQPDKAMTACQRALRLFPQDNVSLSVLGLLYVEQGEGEELGLSFCTKALALDNFNPDHWYRLGRAYTHATRFDQALKACKHCLGLQRSHVAGMIQLGLVYAAMGKAKMAKKYLQRAAELEGCSEVLLERVNTALIAL